ncbi:MAG: ribbon-helix-helix protein, CopG family [Candidatus Hydrogenedentes bacterium]|nr:ribbon-helix-helix protein, CopG family [Candidatus Hydrogenedentota bacterium]
MAISLPDDLFKRADQYAHRTGKSRSQIFSDALRDYLARNDPDEVTASYDRVLNEVGVVADPGITYASQKVLGQVEW